MASNNNTNENLPALNSPATVSLWTDSYPVTVIAISKSGSKITLQRDSVKVVSGSAHDGSAQYEITRNLEGPTDIATRRGNGRYRLQGWNQGGAVNFGFARMYQDPSF